MTRGATVLPGRRPYQYDSVLSGTYNLTTSPITISAPTRYDGATITWTRDLSAGGNTRLFSVRAPLMLVDCEITITVTLVGAPNPAVAAPTYIVQLGAPGILDIADFKMIRCKVNIVNPFTCGVLCMYTNAASRNLLVAKNGIEGAHGGFYIADAVGARIDENQLRALTGAGISTSGSDLKVRRNHFVYDGATSSGDAISGSDLSNALIERNVIGGCGCYGMQFLGDLADLSILRNHIRAGRTTALYIGIDGGATRERVAIDRNVFGAGAAWGCNVSNIAGLAVTRNTFYENVNQLGGTGNTDVTDAENVDEDGAAVTF